MADEDDLRSWAAKETTTTHVWASVQVPGFHRWPEAPESRDYLRSRHRHLFHLRVEIAVTYDERDIEFHDLSDWLRRWWGSRGDGHACDFGDDSCETIAKRIARDLSRSTMLGGRSWSVGVSEDGESGAILYGHGAL